MDVPGFDWCDCGCVNQNERMNAIESMTLNYTHHIIWPFGLAFTYTNTKLLDREKKMFTSSDIDAYDRSKWHG